MASQTVVNPGTIISIAKSGEPYSTEERQLLQNLLFDIITLRNQVDNLNTLFLAHTHKIPSGALAAQSSAPDNTTAAGGAATAPTTNAAPPNVTTTV